MGGQLDRAMAALAMGRSADAVLLEIAATVAIIPALWIAVALFLALEPMP